MFQESLNILLMRTSQVILMEVTPAVRRNLSIGLVDNQINNRCYLTKK